MQWYLNDVSLQGQFSKRMELENVLRELVGARARNDALRRNLRVTRLFPERPVSPGITLRQSVLICRDRDLRNSIITWFDRNGPFVDDNRQPELDDYFEYLGSDVTDSGLGEAARRVKAAERASTFSFEGGVIDFAKSPLSIDHGLKEERLGLYCVQNMWTVNALLSSALDAAPAIHSWQLLVEEAGRRFPHLMVPENVYRNAVLAREPFEASIRDRVLALLGHLNTYMGGRQEGGAEGPEARRIVQMFFTGDRALFTGESETNQQLFRKELTFPDPEDDQRTIFAHWHGKIRHRQFRVHFEWPVPAPAKRLKIVYFGPKLTKE